MKLLRRYYSLFLENVNNSCARRLKNKLKDTDFTIISNNCWGAELYKELNLVYNTPFVGLYIFAPCCIKMLKNLKLYLSQGLAFIETSRYQEANAERLKKSYPIGLLGNDAEIHFVHYATAEEAREKWSRRVKRINWDELFIEFCDRDRFTVHLLEEFERLDFPKKICFTSKDYSGFKSVLWIRDCANETSVMDGKRLYGVCKKYFDIADWLCGGNGRLSLTQKIFSRFIFFLNHPIG